MTDTTTTSFDLPDGSIAILVGDDLHVTISREVEGHTVWGQTFSLTDADGFPQASQILSKMTEQPADFCRWQFIDEAVALIGQTMEPWQAAVLREWQGRQQLLATANELMAAGKEKLQGPRPGHVIYDEADEVPPAPAIYLDVDEYGQPTCATGFSQAEPPVPFIRAYDNAERKQDAFRRDMIDLGFDVATIEQALEDAQVTVLGVGSFLDLDEGPDDAIETVVDVDSVEIPWRTVATHPENFDLPRYADDGTRLTDCCGAYSTFDEHAGLYCKQCFNPVPTGQGDGTETIDTEAS